MPDAPDWYTFRVGSPRHIVGDLGELAVRLGSPVVYDRRGEVLWWDDGRDGIINWEVGGNGTGFGAVAVTTKPLLSPNALEMTAGSIGQVYVSLERYLALPETGKWGIEVAVAFVTTFDYFSVSVHRYDGVNQHRGVARIDWTNEQLSINTVGATYDKVADLLLPWNGNILYHHFKLVLDLDNDTYQRMSYDYNEIDLTSYPMVVQSSAISPSWKILLTLVGHSGANRKAQIGHVILTGNDT